MYYQYDVTYKLPNASGVELTKTIKSLRLETEVIVFTAFGTIEGGVNARPLHIKRFYRSKQVGK